MLRNIKLLLPRARLLAAIERRPLLLHNFQSTRSYAHSRFSERRPGSSRSRDKPERVSRSQRQSSDGSEPEIPESEGTWRDVKIGPFTFRVWESSRMNAGDKPVFEQKYTQEDTRSETPRSSRPEQEESPLWEASRRPPSSDPEEGLKRLLMDNDLLIVTR